MSKFTLSKTAQALVEDAKAAGYTVKVDEWGQAEVGRGGVDIDITGGKYGDAEAYVHFMVRNTAPMNSRLGFATTSKAGFRFDYATGRDVAGRYLRQDPKSLRAVRAMLGLAI